MLEVKVRGLNVLHETLRQMPDKIAMNVARGGLRAAAVVIQKGIKQEIEDMGLVRTGTLRDSIAVSTRSVKGRPTAKVKTDVWYGVILERGSGPHEILPRVGEVLAFNGITVRSVYHPGFTAKPFMRNGFDKNHRAALAVMREYMRNRLEKTGYLAPDPVPDSDNLGEDAV